MASGYRVPLSQRRGERPQRWLWYDNAASLRAI